MAIPHRVVFDANALRYLSNPDVSRLELERALEHYQAGPVHALSTVQSLIGDAEHVRRQFAALAGLGAGDWPVLVDQACVLAAERAGAEIGGPWLHAWDLSEVFGVAHDEERFVAYLSERQDLVRAGMSPLPATHGERLVAWWKELAKKEKIKRRQLFGGNGEIAEGVVGPDGVVTRHILERKAPRGYADAAIKDIANHRVSLALAGLLSLYLLGKIMHSESTPEFRWLKSERDDRNDLHIAAGSAYCDILVTNDKNFRDRLEFLRLRGCIFFDVMSFAEFLGRGA